MKWHRQEISKFLSETMNTTVFASLSLLAVSVWHFMLGQDYQWQSITLISEPSIFERVVYSALTFVTLGAFLYKIKFYQVLYAVNGDWQSFKDAKKIVWIILMGLMYFIIVPTTVSIINHVLSFGYNLLNFVVYLFPPFGVAALIAFVAGYIKTKNF